LEKVTLKVDPIAVKCSVSSREFNKINNIQSIQRHKSEPVITEPSIMTLKPTTPCDDYENTSHRRNSLTSVGRTILARQFSYNKNPRDIEMQERRLSRGARDSERKQFLLVKATESTRQLKELSSKELKDPETIAGMKGTKQVELEVAAKNKSATMLNENEYRYNIRAGIAAFSHDDIERNGRRPRTKLEPFV